jgi:hypothetical protein
MVIEMEFVELEREVAHVFATIRAMLDKRGLSQAAQGPAE